MEDSDIILLIEFRELERKIDELEDILFTNDKANVRKEIDTYELGLMMKQYDVMDKYKRILVERIERKGIPDYQYSLETLQEMLSKTASPVC